MNLLPSKKYLIVAGSLNKIAIALLLIILISLPIVGYSQHVKAPTDSSKAGKNAMPVNNGVLLPQMTVEQIGALVNPSEGSVVYNTVAKRPMFYNGTSWKYFDVNFHTVGEEYGGGIIFYVDPSGDHGLIAAAVDQSTMAKWGFFENPAGATAITVGTGVTNTDKIISINPGDNAGIAARLCSDLTLNGYSDWFLPSLNELKLLYKNLQLKGVGNIARAEYWSSSETDFNNAWLLDFNTGSPVESTVNKPSYVRAIRAF
ncbi:DUF1566 domain-containing protein [Ferruginibacter lapsinanis]|uniref:Lcl domain-containing protein n=1 Tax=Ferruginibacter lapsinanis TaxID=563172 RepID=UPI001E42DAE6|nr:DUF1566 domain-containing protein [Ferruginibacter lapsinanis]UEG49606.1 DUF1566 domain-containing protein [Ferruginibacter lapsinanis]